MYRNWSDNPKSSTHCCFGSFPREFAKCMGIQLEPDKKKRCMFSFLVKQYRKQVCDMHGGIWNRLDISRESAQRKAK